MSAAANDDSGDFNNAMTSLGPGLGASKRGGGMDMGSDFDDILSGKNFEAEETSKKSSKKSKDKKSSKKSKGEGSKSKDSSSKSKDSSKGLHGFDPIIDDSPSSPSRPSAGTTAGDLGLDGSDSFEGAAAMAGLRSAKKSSRGGGDVLEDSFGLPISKPSGGRGWRMTTHFV